MNISGATIIRNGVKLGFPFVEAIRSALPLCSEFIVAVGDSDDDTRARVEQIGDPRIKIIDTNWDMSKRTGGLVLSEQTNIALSHCTGDWICYVQSDEAFHENDYETIRASLSRMENNVKIDGLAFDYYHFYGSYHTVQAGRNWYRQEVRIIRNHRGIVSHGDAQGFRRAGLKLKAMPCGAHVYHYGWARPPQTMLEKIKSFHKLWHDDSWIEQNCGGKELFEFYNDLGNLVRFNGTHPSVMLPLVNNDSDAFINSCRERYIKGRSTRRLLKDMLRRLPVGEHRNFKRVKL